jgi:signal transduction histidine kinase
MDPFIDAQAFRHLLHDVSSRVSGLGLMIDLLEPETAPTPDIRETMERARQASDNLRQVIADLGELSRFLSRRPVASRETVSVRALLNEAADAARAHVSGAVTVECLDGLGSLSVDPELMTYLVGLLIRAYGRDGRPVRVAAWSAPSGDDLTLRVVVDGPGESLSYVLEYVSGAAAAAHGGEFQQIANGSQRGVMFTLPVAPADVRTSMATRGNSRLIWLTTGVSSIQS